MRQEFELTDKSKRKARRIRQREEPKWRIFKPLTVIFFLGMVIFGVIAIMAPYERHDLWGKFGFISSFLMVALATTRGMLLNFTSHWLQDRLNERIWVEDGYLHHFVQTGGGGYFFRTANRTAHFYRMDISSIREVQYDPKSKRLEFKYDGTKIYYSDYRRGEIEDQRNVIDFKKVFYDCTKPSLLEFLKSQEIPYEEKTLDFKIRDATI